MLSIPIFQISNKIESTSLVLFCKVPVLTCGPFLIGFLSFSY